MARTVCFGEIMLRLSPPGFERLFQSPSLHATFGGGEANVAVSLAQFGNDSHYVTRVPKHAVGEAAVKALRAEGVRLDHVIRGGDRLGIYFAETGASQRASRVVYDREGSAFALAATGGMLGVVMGIAISKGVSLWAGWETVVTLSSILLATLVSAGVGLVSGIYPATRAAGLDPIESLRYE